MFARQFSHIDLLGTSVKGPYHIQENLPNQDAWMIQCTNWGLVGVVCDGFGSALKADFGAKQACRAVIEAFSIWMHNTEAPLEILIRLIHDLWGLYIAPHDKKDCATTCLFVGYIKQRVIIGQLGDGIVLLKKINDDSIILIDNRHYRE